MTTDADILAMLRAVPNLNVHDGAVPVDEDEKVIAVAMPYVVYWSSPGLDRDVRFSGAAAGRIREFQLTGVGLSREQAQAALNKAYNAINRKRVGGNLVHLRASAITRKDEDYTAVGGAPLFSGADQYDVGT